MSKTNDSVQLFYDEKDIIANLSYDTVVDPDYGADADGHRGCVATFAEDIELASVEDERGNSLMDEFTEKELDEILEMAKKELDI